MDAAAAEQLDILTAARQEIDRQVSSALLGRYAHRRWPTVHAVVVGGDGDATAIIDREHRVFTADNDFRGPDDSGCGDIGDRLWGLITYLPTRPVGSYTGGEGRILVLPAGSGKATARRRVASPALVIRRRRAPTT